MAFVAGWADRADGASSGRGCLTFAGGGRVVNPVRLERRRENRIGQRLSRGWFGSTRDILRGVPCRRLVGGRRFFDDFSALKLRAGMLAEREFLDLIHRRPGRHVEHNSLPLRAGEMEIRAGRFLRGAFRLPGGIELGGCRTRRGGIGGSVSCSRRGCRCFSGSGYVTWARSGGRLFAL